mmetsp:Transcript_14916/g.25482  ORF Transcript_14916/g.25482 Transcript_14916/m.25482 type:complete len:97 (-) Transcript_14916:28-318(-)
MEPSNFFMPIWFIYQSIFRQPLKCSIQIGRIGALIARSQSVSFWDGRSGADEGGSKMSCDFQARRMAAAASECMRGSDRQDQDGFEVMEGVHGDCR